MEKKRVKCKLFTMLLCISVIPLVLAVAIVSVLALRVTKSNMEESVKNTLFVAANNLANHCKENEITAMNASDYYDYLDSLKDNNIEMAILAEGMPCTTSIKNENEYRIREIQFQIDIFADEETLKNGYLTIEAKRTDCNGENCNYIKRERSVSCSRSYYVGSDVREEEVSAKYENGILSLVVPKAKEKQISSGNIEIL